MPPNLKKSLLTDGVKIAVFKKFAKIGETDRQ